MQNPVVDKAENSMLVKQQRESKNFFNKVCPLWKIANHTFNWLRGWCNVTIWYTIELFWILRVIFYRRHPFKQARPKVEQQYNIAGKLNREIKITKRSNKWEGGKNKMIEA